MAQPTSTDVHVDSILTNISTAYIQSRTDFVATQVFPIVPVMKASGKYFTYTKADWFRDEAKLRADGSPSAGSGYNVSTATYTCDVFALHKDVGPQAMANADEPINMLADATRFVTQTVLLRREMQWVSDAFGGSKWATDVTPGTLWSAGGNPFGDIETGRKTILQNTGYEPNTLVLGYDSYKVLRQHADLVDRFKYTNAGAVVDQNALASVFGVQRVLVAKSIKNTAVEGASASYSFTAGENDALLCYVNPNPGTLAPSAGYTFVWNGLMGGAQDGIGVTQEPVPNTGGAVRVEAQAAFDCKLVGTDLGYYFSGAVS